MENFAGFNDWIEIFAGGPQRASNGQVHDGDALIDSAINTFDPREHEPPIVVGHPSHNAPAFGWVERLNAFYKNGRKVLVAKFKQVAPEFEKMVQQGLYKTRSAAFYPDGRLRHVGFLGATPPAVKGLVPVFNDASPPVEFAFDEAVSEGGIGDAASRAAISADILGRRAMAILSNPPKYDKCGCIIWGEMTYSRALEIAQQENPEAARDYADSMRNSIYRETIL